MTSKSLSDELGNGTSTELAQPLTTSQKLLRPCTSWVDGQRPESFRVEKIVPAGNGDSGEHKVCRFLYLHPHPRSVDGAFFAEWRATEVSCLDASLITPADVGQPATVRSLYLADQCQYLSAAAHWGLSAQSGSRGIASVFSQAAAHLVVS